MEEEIRKATDDLLAFGSGVLFLHNDGTARHIPLSDIKFELDAPDVGDPTRIVHKDNAGNDVVSTASILNAPGQFGAIDTLDPNARLNLLIETARTFRLQHPDTVKYPVRAPELAVNEVLRQRKVISELNDKVLAADTVVSFLKQEIGLQTARADGLLDKLAELQRPLWQRAVKWFAGFAP